MKKTICVAFGLLLTTSLSAQSPTESKAKQEVNGRQIQTDSVTNVAGYRIITEPAKMQDGNGAIEREQGTDAVANSTTSSNKPNENSPRTSNNGKSAENANKGLTAKGKIPVNKNGSSATATTNSAQTSKDGGRLERTSRGSTPTGSDVKKNKIEKGRNPANTPTGKPKVHASKDDKGKR